MKFKINKKTGILILGLIIIAELIYTTFTFACKKENIHSDEMWTYGLSNSYYKAFVHLKADHQNFDTDEEDLDNINQWISTDVLKNYITVQPGERFSYKSVYKNQTYDVHPPMYYFLVHTVCSFFPNKFSYWFAYIINAIALIFTQIYLYKLVMLITKDHKPYIALLTCLMYGCGVGALETFIFLRMYAAATALTTAHIYYQFRLYYSENFNMKKNLPPVIISGLLGLLTHNFFAAAMGICTACICLWLLCRKKIKKMLIYGFSMLGTLGCSLLIFPYLLKQSTSMHSNFQIKVPLVQQFKTFLTSISNPNFGIKFSIYDESNADIYITVGIFCLIVISIPLCFLFRKEKWFIKFREFILGKIKGFAKNVSEKLKSDRFCYIKKINFPILFLFVIIMIYVFINSKIVSTVKMSTYLVRYTMPIFPLACAMVGSAIYYVVSWIPYIKKAAPVICTAIICGFIVKSNLSCENDFLFQQPDDYKDLAKLTKGAKCEVVIPAPWVMTCFQAELMNCTQVKFSDYKHFYNVDDNTIFIDGIEKDKPMYLIFLQDSEESDLKAGIKKIKKVKATTIPEKDVVNALKENPDVNSVKKVSHIIKNKGVFNVYKIN